MAKSETAPDVNIDDLHSLTLVLSSARSGSTLLCHDIASLGGLGMPKEYLLSLRKEATPTGAGEGVVLERIAAGVRPDAPGVAAVKLMLRQAPATHEVLFGQRPPSAEALPGVMEWAKKRFDRLFVVFLVRNAVDQAISRVVAETTGVFHSSSSEFGGSHRTAEIPNVNQRILENLDRVVRDRAILLDVQAQYADTTLLLTYDELSRQPAETATKLVAHARKAGFEVRHETTTRKLEKVISAERATQIREAFLEYLKNETGVDPGHLAGAGTPTALDD